jgi:hypothetical protein
MRMTRMLMRPALLVTDVEDAGALAEPARLVRDPECIGFRGAVAGDRTKGAAHATDPD